MRDTLFSSLYDREIDPGVRSKRWRSLYSDRHLIADLDIVNELDGHSGCVNALSWSKSGSLLASGSDDQHLNIHTYQPATSNSQFQLTTTVATGHTQNIFSVKFMPHHNDRTVITAAGDGEVRIFDLEYAGQARAASGSASIASVQRRRGRNHIYNSVKYLSDGDTDCRVYRSHGDRVKRIVTESSPHLFLTCSEDGEVRQWDLRQPSSAYPAPPGGRHGSATDSAVPPPLISYKRYQLDLNTISCSASQPHYIALGGAHLHAFLHDRRMMGRDRLQEAGKSAHATSPEDEEKMNEATQCVRKFAPKGQSKMKRTENGHITACKISDARPDEMIVSWSGDHIYSFNLVRSPDASEREEKVGPLDSTTGNRVKESRERKRKRMQTGSETSLGHEAMERASSRPRTESVDHDRDGATLRVRYQNGQSEDIPLSRPGQHREQLQRALTAQQRDAQRIAKATVKIRASLFGTTEAQTETVPDASSSDVDHQARYTSTLGQAASILSDIDEAMRDWRYPLDPTPDMVLMQQTLRRNREGARRFVQAAGSLARVLGGKLQTPSGTSPMIVQFTSVEARSNDREAPKQERFGYDFLKAVLLWLESGIGRLIEGFTSAAEMSDKAALRLPIPEAEASTEAIDDYLIPYLLRLASDDRPIVNTETNRFEVDENRQLFPSETAAVLAFAAAVKIPFADLSSAIVRAEGEDRIEAQDRQTAMRFWGQKVGKGVLLNAAEGLTFGVVDRAFGGSGRVVTGLEEETGEEEEAVRSAEVLDQSGRMTEGATAEDLADVVRQAREAEMDWAREERSSLLTDEPIEEDDVEDDDDDDDDAYDQDIDDEDNDTSDPDEEDGVPNPGLPRFMYASAFERRRMREKVQAGVPCSGSTRVYRGHCNVKTVKDVNYFGPDDSYVVSGSDDGKFFLWDRKTSELVNVLEGDGEVVNVVQGHPYETCLAVSGIDHTIKIFSPDARAREAARKGVELMASDASGFSSLAWPPRVGRSVIRRRRQTEDPAEGATTTSEPAVPTPAHGTDEEEDEGESYVSPTGLASRKRMQNAYAIMQNNDVERQGGGQDAYITVRDIHPLLLIMQRAFW